MMFCPKCNSLMMSSGGQMKCRKCGYLQAIEKEDDLKITATRIEKEITIVDDEEKAQTLPTTNVPCPECGNNLAFWWLRQLRSADESEVRFFRCTKCSHTWREYD
ncbi:transcription factor S [Methanofollis formosanus]|uniref:Transcription factor S n=1 Tax=Methanofollis formosanus TaxID=299308 RepID=A0A8G1EH22_9EURY|nr:transcription factor S [Methanofollis formosanus]QYZ80385.1 transcription factor S [Methanofollis formosanus]